MKEKKKNRRLRITFHQLKKYFIDQNLSVSQCATRLRCSTTTIYRRLRIFGLCHGVKNNPPEKQNKRQNKKNPLLQPVASIDRDIKAGAHANTARYISNKLKATSQTPRNKKQSEPILDIEHIIDQHANRLVEKAKQIRSTIPELIREAANRDIKRESVITRRKDDDSHLL